MWREGYPLSSRGRKPKRSWVLIFVIVVLGGMGYRYYRLQDSQEVAGAVEPSQVVTVQRGDLSRSVSSTGAITANRDLELAFDVNGRIKSVLVKTTQTVAQGEKLAELDSTKQELAYLSAKREFELAKFEAAPNVVKEKELALQVAEAELKATSLHAPFDGFVAAINVQEDEWANSGTTVLRLLDTSQLFLEVGVDEIDIRHVQVGQGATVTVDAYPELFLPGTVVEVGIVPDKQGQVVVFPVKIELDELDPRVRVGMSAEAKITVQKAENALIVPSEAITQGRGRTSVMMVVGDALKEVPVSTGLSDGFMTEIIEGLREGDKILVSNHQLYRSLQGGQSTPGRSGMFFQPAGGIRR